MKSIAWNQDTITSVPRWSPPRRFKSFYRKSWSLKKIVALSVRNLFIIIRDDFALGTADTIYSRAWYWPIDNAAAGLYVDNHFMKHNLLILTHGSQAMAAL